MRGYSYKIVIPSFKSIFVVVVVLIDFLVTSILNIE